MNITDELRSYAKGYELLVNYRLLEIADRIDAKYAELRDDLKKENADLLETLDDTEERYVAEWNRACNAERENEKLRNLLLDFRDAMWDYGEWTEPFDERMLELGVFRGRR